MAFNARTPQSVLDAPSLTPVIVSAQHGPTRRERRHVTLNAKGQRVNPGLGKTFTIPKAARQPATNVPHVATPHRAYWTRAYGIPYPRRSKKAIRHVRRFT